MINPLEAINRIPREEFEGLKKIIVHANCPDGMASAMILHDALPKLPIEFVTYGTPEHNQPACPALFCDFSPPMAKLQDWIRAGAIVLDHHKTARPVVEAFELRGVYADETEHRGVSGATLAMWLWEHLDVGTGSAPPLMAMFASLAAIRDTWQTDSEAWTEACEQAAALLFYPSSYLMVVHEPWLQEGERQVGRILHQQRLAAARIVVVETPLAFDSVLLFNDKQGIVSDVAEYVREWRTACCQMVAGFYFDHHGDLVFSLRSCDESVDVSVIAKAMGGGGHRGAAGFRIPRVDVMPFDRSPRLCLEYALNIVGREMPNF